MARIGEGYSVPAARLREQKRTEIKRITSAVTKAPKERELRLFEPGRGIPLEQEIRQQFPWSKKGRELIGKVQLSAAPPPPMAYPVTGEVKVPSAAYVSRKVPTPEWQLLWDKLHRVVTRKPPMSQAYEEYARAEQPGVVSFGWTGESIPHEYSHAAADYLDILEPSARSRFRKDLLGWLNRKPDDPNKRLVRRSLEEQGISEAYAWLGMTPHVIPGELWGWYPQFDFTRRRAMGVRQPLVPPPPAPTGPLRK